MLQWLKKNPKKQKKNPSVVTQSLTATLFYLFYPSLQMIAWIQTK